MRPFLLNLCVDICDVGIVAHFRYILCILKYFEIFQDEKTFLENFPLEIVKLCNDFDQFSSHICLICISHVFIPISCLCVVVFAVMD